jgi:alpha-D-ribose 1-methylphosphonate 5-triphosphate synthase subunit PhnG
MGLVRDLDNDQATASCQVVVTSPPGRDIIGRTSDERVMSVLGVAFARQLETAVILGPNNCVVVAQIAPMGAGGVDELAYDASTSRASFRLSDGTSGWTDYATAQRIIETAIVSDSPLQYVDVDEATHRLRRAKVNSEPPAS